MRTTTILLLCSSLFSTNPLHAQTMSELCGDAPKGLLISNQTEETIKYNLSQDISGIGLVQATQRQRTNLFQEFNNPDRTFVDAYLAFVTCTLLHTSSGSASEKIDQVTRIRLEINNASNVDASATDTGFSLAGFRGSVFGYGVAQTDFENTKALMEDLGLNFSGYRSYVSQERFDWFAGRSTVFYYAEENHSLAQQLANRLEQKTGLSFVTSRGAGLAVYEGQEAYTFFIHVIQ